MKLPSEKSTKGKVRIVVRGQDSFRTTAASMIIASGFERNPDNVGIIDTNSNYNKLFAGWGFHNLAQVNAPYTLEKMLESIEACETKNVLVLDSLDSFISTLLALNTTAEDKDWVVIIKSWQQVVARLMLSPCHVIVSLRVEKELPDGLEVFGLDEMLLSRPVEGLNSNEFEIVKNKLSELFELS